MDREIRFLPGGYGDGLPLETVFEALHHFDVHASCWNSQFGVARSVKVVHLKRTLGPHEVVIGIHPRVIGSIGPLVLAHHEDTRRCRVTRLVQYGNAELAHRLQVVLLFCNELSLGAAGNGLRPQRSISASIRNECDLLSIRRPAGRYVVEIAVRKWERIAALGGQHP